MSGLVARAVKVPDPVWDRAMERAKAEGRTLSDVVRVALEAYGDGRYHADPPRRRRPERRRA